MKKIIILTSLLAMAIVYSGMAQSSKKVEVLYFKANLACCKAKACNALEGDIKAIVEKNYTDGSVVFTEVRIADESNQDLVAKYDAQSQTVIIRYKKGKKEKSVDVTEKVRKYAMDQDKTTLEKELLAIIDDLL
jgi:hypothetical protein